MLYLCRMCQAQAENIKCEICGALTIECEELYMISMLYTCNNCGSRKFKTIDNDTPDSLDEGSYKMLRCPACDSWEMHTVITLGITKLPNYDYKLEKMYNQEIRR